MRLIPKITQKRVVIGLLAIVFGLQQTCYYADIHSKEARQKHRDEQYANFELGPEEELFTIRSFRYVYMNVLNRPYSEVKDRIETILDHYKTVGVKGRAVMLDDRVIGMEFERIDGTRIVDKHYELSHYLLRGSFPEGNLVKGESK